MARRSAAARSTSARESLVEIDEVERMRYSGRWGGSVFIGRASDITVRSDPTTHISRLSAFNRRICGGKLGEIPTHRKKVAQSSENKLIEHRVKNLDKSLINFPSESMTFEGNQSRTNTHVHENKAKSGYG